MKKRNEWTYVSSKETVESIEFTYDSDQDSMTVNFEVENSYREASYERKKNDKVLCKVPLDSEALYLNDKSTLLAYDTIVAIDTNTKTISDTDVSVTGIAISKWVDQQSYSYEVPFCIEFSELIDPKEKMGWIAAMEELSKKGYFKSSSKVLLIVDAFLNEIDAINGRKKPIVNNYYLPNGFEIGYASADAGAEYMPNKLLKMSDKAAAQVLKYLIDYKSFNTSKLESPYYKAYRLIYRTKRDGGIKF